MLVYLVSTNSPATKTNWVSPRDHLPELERGLLKGDGWYWRLATPELQRARLKTVAEVNRHPQPPLLLHMETLTEKEYAQFRHDYVLI